MAVLILGIFRGLPLFYDYAANQEGIFYTAVALSVAAIPEGLLIAVTVVLAIGMQRILKNKALVRKLVAAETLGSASIICTDKTGTITTGKMDVYKIITADILLKNETDEKMREINEREILKISALCNDSFIENPSDPLKNWRIVGTPTDSALLWAAIQSGLNKIELEKKEARIEEQPFDSENKFMVTRHQLDNNFNHLFIKGAPEVILKRCSKVKLNEKIVNLNKKYFQNLNKKCESFSREGLRLLAFAYKKIKKTDSMADNLTDLIFSGFIALKDPVRPEAAETLKLCARAGIKTIIVTGDHRLTAKAIANEIGLKVEDENIIEGAELDQLDDKSLNANLHNYKVYARVNPEHKLRIISAWQKKNQVVAMTGDGVNDAPALKAADIGIALGSGTDVAKESSDLILLDNNFKTILDAIKQGRIIFDNIRKVILYLLADSFSEIILVAGSLLANLPLPILPVQILWINLVDDVFPAMAMTVEPGEKEIISDPPRKKNESVINSEIKLLIFIIGLVVNLVLFCLYLYLLSKFSVLNLPKIRTIIFSVLALDSLLYAFSCRSFRHSIFSKNIFSNKTLIFSVLIGFVLQLLAIYEPHLQKIIKTVPLNFSEWLIIILLALIDLAAIEITKHFFIIKKNE